jgi:hypothetical protein
MTSLLQRYLLRCPYRRAREYLRASLNAIAETGETRVIRLRAPISHTGGALEKDVYVRFGHGVDPLHFDEPWTVHWSAASGAYPEFDGTLTVRADEDYDTSVLELSGNYTPPFGVAGAAFDALLGSRIASSTAREFLRAMADDMEASYGAETRKKSGGI